MPEFTYPQVGATRHGSLPDGYRQLSYRARIGPGDVFRSAAEAVMTWRMHRGTGARVVTAAARAAPGVQATVRLGWGPVAVSAPCQVVWTVEEADQVGFGYGTLAGHPVSGEESFVVRRADDGSVWFTVTAFSRPASWYVSLAGPVTPVLQRAYARRCAAVLRRLSR